MTDSLEYQTLVQSYNKVVIGLKLDPATVAEELIARSLIPPSVASEMAVQSVTKAQKARTLVQYLLDKVELSSDHYYNFVSTISELGWLNDLVGILTSCHSKSYRAVVYYINFIEIILGGVYSPKI